MGGFNPVSLLINAASNLSGLNSGYNASAGAYQAAQQQHDLQQRKINDDEKAAKEKLALDSAEQGRQRREALKRTVAKQRAAFGGQGIDTTDGSGEAVLLGMFQENDADREYRARLDRLKKQSIQDDAAYARKRNLLELQRGYETSQAGLYDTATNALKGADKTVSAALKDK